MRQYVPLNESRGSDREAEATRPLPQLKPPPFIKTTAVGDLCSGTDHKKQKTITYGPAVNFNCLFLLKG